MRTRRTKVLVAIAALLLLLWIAGSVMAQRSADEPSARSGLSIASVVSPLLQYQGRLTDPSTGEVVADGTYTMIFSLYNVAGGGSPLWTETKGVEVQGGLFSTALGDTTSLDQGLFDGQALWLGVTVGGDAEATPRQQVLPVAYALSLVPGAVISATSSTPVLQVNNAGSGEALHVGGPTVLDGDLTVGGSLSGGSHTHTGADIVDGSVTSADIEDYTRVLYFPAQGLADDPADSTIEPNYDGLRWQNVSTSARLIISRPADWDGVSDVNVRLFFYPTTATAGNVQFFIRPRVYDPGDTFLDTTGVLSTIVSVSQANQYNEMLISIPASRFGTKAWWYLVFQRNISVASPYPDDVVLMTVSLSYSAVR
jgi:hypothetical protein